MNMYQTLGMPMSQRWRLCVGPDNCQHEPQVMPPHEEDILDLKFECCCLPKSRATHRRHSIGRGQKCGICNRLRKYAISFEYMEIKNWIGCMCKS